MRAALPHAASLALVLFAASPALADVVGPPPEECPAGSRPSTAHSGPFCAPTTSCEADADCETGTCTEVRQCIETRGCGGLEPPDAEPCTLEHVVGPCGDDGACEIGVCESRRACDAGGCTVAAPGDPRAGGLTWGAAALLAGGLLRARRRR
jgi:MYXO-CTERM domain-containing protein